jgi:hypothetical protein
MTPRAANGASAQSVVAEPEINPAAIQTPQIAGPTRSQGRIACSTRLSHSVKPIISNRLRVVGDISALISPTGHVVAMMFPPVATNVS